MKRWRVEFIWDDENHPLHFWVIEPTMKDALTAVSKVCFDSEPRIVRVFTD